MAKETTLEKVLEEQKTKKVPDFSLEALLNPTVSRVTKSLDNVIISIFGLSGTGKTPCAAAMPNAYYLAFGKSGLSGLNDVAFQSINSWSDFKRFVKVFTDKKNYEAFHEKFQTLVLDELEVLYRYCEKYVANSEGVNKIKEGNGGYGLWSDLKEEWETEMLKVIGSGFCVVFVLHAMADDNGYYFPVGDRKRMLPIILNHSEIIGYVKGNGVDPDTGRSIHSSLMLAGTDEYFARTRNEYFDPVIEDFTADNLIQAYYDAIDRQEKAEGVKAVTKEERDAMFETEKRDFDDLMDEVQEVGGKIVQKYGSKEKLTEVVESVLGKGALVSTCTPKQQEAVEVILNELKGLL